jgi:hypothetical protein
MSGRCGWFCGLALVAAAACADRTDTPAAAPAAPAVSTPGEPAPVVATAEPSAATVEPVAPPPVAASNNTLAEELGPYEPAAIDGDVPPFGPFDKKSLPSSKYRLLMAVDAALRSGDPNQLGRVVLDEAAMRPMCTAAERDQRLLSRMEDRRSTGARRFAECAAFVDWQRAERLALHTLDASALALRDCGLRRERGKLTYAIDDSTVEIDVGISVMGEKRAILFPIRCFSRHAYDPDGTKRRGTPAEMVRDFVDKRTNIPCPALGWPHVSGWSVQGRPVCPQK